VARSGGCAGAWTRRLQAHGDVERGLGGVPGAAAGAQPVRAWESKGRRERNAWERESRGGRRELQAAAAGWKPWARTRRVLDGPLVGQLGLGDFCFLISKYIFI
jgi:hypothetical protein